MPEDAHDIANPRAAIRWRHTYGNLLDQDADALVNPWNHNFPPRWSLLVCGVSGQHGAEVTAGDALYLSGATDRRPR